MANLIITLSNGLVIKTKVSKINPDGVEKPAIIQRDENGNLVLSKRKTDTGIVFDTFKWININEKGEEYTPKSIKDYALNPETGKEELTKPYESTQHVEFKNSLPLTYANVLLQESLYEVYAEDEEGRKALFEELEKAINNDLMFLHENFVWRKGYSAYHVVFMPHREEDGSFVWIMMTTKGKTILKHKMSAVAEEEEAKKIKVLPSLLNTLIGGN